MGKLAEAELIVQLTDLHVQVGDEDARATERVERAVELVRRIRPRPLAVLLTGDLTNDEQPEQVERLVALLEPLLALGIPVLPMVGNHDDRAQLRAALERLDGIAELGQERHLQYEARVGSFRVLALDTQHTGHADGKHCDTRHAWLEQRLAEDSKTPTILAMHHPPVACGLPAFDAIGLRADHAARFAELVVRSRNVERIVCGHVHRPWTGVVAGRVPVFGCPSVYLPARPDYRPERPIELVDGPVGIGVHLRTGDGALTSHVRLIGPVPHQLP